MAFNSEGGRIGVAPYSSILASFGPETRAQYSFICLTDSGASRKVMSQPTSRKARHLSIPASNPSVFNASVRANTKGPVPGPNCDSYSSLFYNMKRIGIMRNVFFQYWNHFDTFECYLASHAALTRCTASPKGTTDFPAT
jgi:hypothetical protein